MLFDHADHEPHKISRRHLYQCTRNRELVSLTTERTDGSATRDREVVPCKRFRCKGSSPVIPMSYTLRVRVAHEACGACSLGAAGLEQAQAVRLRASWNHFHLLHRHARASRRGAWQQARGRSQRLRVAASSVGRRLHSGLWWDP